MALLSKPGLIPLQIENDGNLITTQVNKINFVVAVSGSVGNFNDITIEIGTVATTSFIESASYAINSGNTVSASYAINSGNTVSASYALTSTSASYAATASFVAGGASGFPYTGSAQITGSLGITGSFSQSGSANIFLQGLINQTTATTHVVTFNNSTGQLFITASSAFGGGGGGGTPGGATNTIQFNNAGTFSGSGNFTLVGGNFVYLTGSLLVTGSSQFLGPVTGSSFTGSFTGSLFGTSSWAVSASQTVSSSFATNASFSTSSSFATSASFAINSSFAISSSFATSASQAISSSFATSASQAISSSFATSASFAISSSIAVSASWAVSSSFAISSSFTSTSSFAPLYLLVSNTSSMLSLYLLISNTVSMLSPYLLTTQTGSFATTGSNTFKGNQTISGSVNTTGSINLIGPVTQSNGGNNLTTFQEVIYLPSSISSGPPATLISKAAGSPVSMFIEYQIIDVITNTDQRSGYIMANFNSSGTPTSTFTETVTADIGNTTGVVFSTNVGATYDIQATNSGVNPYTFKAILRYF